MLQAEGYIRGYAEVEIKGHKELEIELKYHEGEPAIRELKRELLTQDRRNPEIYYRNYQHFWAAKAGDFAAAANEV